MKLRNLLGLVGTAGMLATTPLAAQQAASACVDRATIRRTTPLTATGQPIYVERADPRAITGGIALIGEPTYIWAARDTFVDREHPGRSSFLVDSSRDLNRVPIGVRIAPNGIATPILRPKGVVRMLTPRTTSLSAGRVLVVWGSDAESAPDTSTVVRRVWSAIYDGATWTRPALVFAGDPISWNQQSMAIVADDSDVVHLAVPSIDRVKGWVGIVHATFDGTGWHTEELAPEVLPPTRVAMVGGKSRPMRIFYAGLVNADGAFTPAIISWSRATAGQAWQRDIVVRPLAPNTGGAITAALVGDVAHLYWTSDHQQPVQRIEHWRLATAGAWQKVDSIVVGASQLIAMPTERGVVFVAQDSRTGSVMMLSSTNAGWAVPVVLNSEQVGGTVTAGLHNGRELIVTWGVIRDPGANGLGWPIAPQLQVVRLALRCD